MSHIITIKKFAFALIAVLFVVFAISFVLPQVTDGGFSIAGFTLGAPAAEACCGGGGGGGDDDDDVVIIRRVAVCDAFSVSPKTLAHPGGNVVLTWATTNATGVSINQGVGTVPADGSKTVNVTATKTFTLTALGTGGNDTCTVTVTVQPAKPVAKCDSFTVNRSTIAHPGGNVVLTWATTNATGVSINQGVGTVPADGSKTVNVTATKTFTLTALGTGGNDTCTVTVTVSPIGAPSCDSFTGSPKTLPHGGGDVTLTWATTNAGTVSINQGIGTVTADGSKTVNVTSSKTFVLTATNSSGSVSCNVPITVGPAALIPKCDFFNIDKSVVDKGESFELSWETTNADSVSINQGIGSVSVDGTFTTSTQDDKTFTLTATKGSNSVTCSQSVSVRSGGGGGGSSSPKCELKISDKKIKKGDEVTLTWETTRADEVVIKDNHGKTILDTDDLDKDDRKDFYDGKIDVSPTKDTTYTLEASKGSKDRKCKVSVDVDSDVTVVEVRDQKPIIAGIALTQVPYTGFEAGPALTFIFYALLTLWGLFIAYTLVIKKKNS